MLKRFSQRESKNPAASRFRGRFHSALRCARFLILAIPLVPATAQVCSHPANPEFYNGYQVDRVVVDSPIFKGAGATLGWLKSEIDLKERATFTAEAYSEGVKQIKTALDNLSDDSAPAVRVTVVVGGIEDCFENASPKRLSIRYRVFDSDYRRWAASLFEVRRSESEKPASTAGEVNTRGRVRTSLLGGYDPRLKVNAGVRLEIPTGVSWLGALRMSSLHSGISGNDDVELTGERAVSGSWLDRAQWRFGYHREDTPVGNRRVVQSQLRAQFDAMAKPSRRGAPVLRYGWLLGGGNQKTDTPDPLNLSTQNQRVGALKMYTGITARQNRHSYAGSYGLQLGTTGRDHVVDFVKQVVNAGWLYRHLPADRQPGDVHRPLDIEFAGGGGVIATRGVTPLSERFFGGARTNRFIDGSDWAIWSGPLIRSIPAFRFSGPQAGGGTAFYSTNLTVSKVLWGRPLLPKEIAEDPQFPKLIEGALETARTSLVSYFKSKDPQFQAALVEADKIKVELDSVLDRLAALKDAPASAARQITAAQRSVKAARRMANSARTLMGPLISRYGPKAISDVEKLAKTLETANPERAAALSASAKTLKDGLAAAQDALKGIASRAAEARAAKDIDIARPILDSMMHELNMYSLAPVIAFDTARLWPDPQGVRYAVGGGLRFSLLNVNLTVGYAYNLRRFDSEPRGAVFVGFDVSRLFR